MKKYLSFIFILIVAVSCDDFLDEDPKGQLTPETFFSTTEDLMLAEDGLYRIFYNSEEHWGISTFLTLGSNDIGSINSDGMPMDKFAIPSDHALIYRYWSRQYALIKGANNIINNYERCEASQEFKDAVAGAAHFMRAFAYFNLVRSFNKIPFYTDDGLYLDIEPSEPEVVYTQIVEDLKQAESLCPDTYSADPKRKNIAVTSGIAKSVLAYVYLQMTGYPINDASKASLSASKAKEVLDNEATYGYGLLDNCADLWKWDNYMHKEIVFGLYYNQTYGGNARAPLEAKPEGYGGGWDKYYAEIKFFNDFPEGPRKEASFETNYFINGTWEDYTALYSQHPYYKKYWQSAWTPVDPETGEQMYWETPTNWNSSRTDQILRHANTLLVYAEAQTMADGNPNSEAYAAVNRVRNRAGLSDLTPGLSGSAFRDSVVMERAWEFAGGEWFMAPWYDLVRLERVEEVNADRTNENEILKTIDKEDYFMPIPQADILLNPKINQ